MLFHKRTKHIIRYIWIVLSIIIILSMVVTYSGFTMLARSGNASPSTVQTDPAIASQEMQLDTNTAAAPSASTVSPQVPAAPQEQLKFDIQ